MHAFEYVRAQSLADAAQQLQADSDARLLSGGMTLLPTMKMRLAAPSRLVDITRIPELQGISCQGDRLLVGAAVRHSRVASHTEVQQRIPALAALAGGIGDPQVRARGTLGGSVANNDPSADYPAAVLGLDGIILTDRREIPAESFFQGLFTTALSTDEIITGVSFRIPVRAAYAKFSQAASGYAMTGVFIAQFQEGLRVSVTGAGPGVFRWKAAETALQEHADPTAFERTEIDEAALNTDLHAPSAYRAQLMRVMGARALHQMSQD